MLGSFQGMYIYRNQLLAGYYLFGFLNLRL